MNQEGGEKGRAPLPTALRWGSGSSAGPHSCWTRAGKPRANSRGKPTRQPLTHGTAEVRRGQGGPDPTAGAGAGAGGSRGLSTCSRCSALRDFYSPCLPGHVLLLLLLRAGSCSPCEIAARVLHPVNPLYCHPRSPPCPLHPCPLPRWPATHSPPFSSYFFLIFLGPKLPVPPRTPRLLLLLPRSPEHNFPPASAALMSALKREKMTLPGEGNTFFFKGCPKNS